MCSPSNGMSGERRTRCCRFSSSFRNSPPRIHEVRARRESNPPIMLLVFRMRNRRISRLEPTAAGSRVQRVVIAQPMEQSDLLLPQRIRSAIDHGVQKAIERPNEFWRPASIISSTSGSALTRASRFTSSNGESSNGVAVSAMILSNSRDGWS